MATERQSMRKATEILRLKWVLQQKHRAIAMPIWLITMGRFSHFEQTLLLSTHVVDLDDRAHELFGALADRFDREPGLGIQFFINVPVVAPGESQERALDSLRTRFRERIWPGRRLPEVWYDPRTLEAGHKRAVLHAKCIVADNRDALVTSANFTEAAHERNVELGLLIRDSGLAQAIVRPFTSLIKSGLVSKLM